MNKKFLGITVFVTILIVGSILLSSRQNTSQNTLQVTASFYPLAELTRQVGGDKVVVITLVPTGTEPHDYNPTPQERVGLERSKIFIYNGAGFEPWVDRILPDLRSVKLIDASKNIQNIQLLPAIPKEGEADKQVLYDPHFWLDPVLMQQISNAIAQKLAEADPANSFYYQENATRYNEKLSNLDDQFRQGLSSCQKKDAVTSHAAFAYLAKRYGFIQIPIAGLSEEEPSPARLAEVSQLAKEKNIKYIFFETLVSPKLSETIAQEVGAKTLVLNPIEGITQEEKQQGENYITLMENNLINLKIALDCL
ncbi:MAG: zinc ABC transporter substrate-binding protein [Candidatus Vogelbacteria bacterium]|nr:zinc ABC transporter substrate-binding protein [Candidatus Vogelbacteria bacterium]